MLSQGKAPLTLQYLPVVVYLKVLSKTIKLGHISHLLLQLLIERTIRLFVNGNDEEDKSSFKYVPLW